jgi:hypothetical protein
MNIGHLAPAITGRAVEVRSGSLSPASGVQDSSARDARHIMLTGVSRIRWVNESFEHA